MSALGVVSDSPGGPVMSLPFQSRWTLSYLRGPITREEIAALMRPLKAGQSHAPVPTLAPQHAVPPMANLVHASVIPVMPVSAPAPVPAPPEPTRHLTSAQPVVPGLTPFFVPTRGAVPTGATLLYQAFLLGWADVVGENKKMGRK